MIFYSTNNKPLRVSLRDAILQGQPEDGGLFFPCEITRFSSEQISDFAKLPFGEMCYELLAGEIPREVISKAISFDAPLIPLSDSLHVLELFHGPTLAFKDFGARFLATLLSYYNNSSELTVLVATSGDTGSAVASAFLEQPGIRVVLLYPSGMVSEIQEKQLTTYGHNIVALEVQGNFDDCQRMVKQAFADAALRKDIVLTSANSINIGRLIPQSFYYFRAFAQLPQKDQSFVMSVPSGNFGNLTAGLIAKRMGLPAQRFIAATNINDVVPEYLVSGKFQPRQSRQTISNAMDVGNPSNFIRMLELYDHDLNRIRKDVVGSAHTDDQTVAAMREVYDKYGYVMDPHGAVAYLGWKRQQVRGIVLETAHPAKFQDVVEKAIGRRVEIPERLQVCLKKQKQSIVISNTYEALKQILV